MTSDQASVAQAARRWRNPLLLAVASLAIAVNAFWMLQNLARLVRSYEPIEQTVQVRDLLGQVLEQLLNAETGQRGYLLTRNPGYLQPYHQSQAELARLLAALQAEVQAGRAAPLASAVQAKLDELAKTIALSLAGEHEAALALVSTERGKQLMDQVRQALAEQLGEQNRRLALTRADYDAAVQRSYWVFGLAVAFNVLLLAVLAGAAHLATRRREAAAVASQAHHLALSQALATTQAHNVRMRRLSTLSQYLQSARDLNEAAALLSRHLPELFEAASGALYLMADSRNHLRLIGHWGEAAPPAQCLPDECWGLRRGQPYWQAGQLAPQGCAHLAALAADSNSLCLPLATGGDLIGLLSMQQLQGAGSDIDPYLSSAAETIALALGNLRLRESLRQQSLRDALTGLYNRRFLEESLQRELLRAERLRGAEAGTGVAVLMLDVDHFKRFNDQHGHEAGDLVLKEVGQLLRQFCRDSDIACRYGGEEFTLVLPQISETTALERATHVLDAVRGLRLQHRSEALGPVTASLGLAMHPLHGQTPEALLRAADAALYRAKHAGRDRVMLAAPVVLKRPG